MTTKQLIKIADRGYGGGIVKAYYDGDGSGDTLAEFVATELRECCEPLAPSKSDMLKEGIRVIQVAIQDLQNVEQELLGGSMTIRNPMTVRELKSRTEIRSDRGMVIVITPDDDISSGQQDYTHDAENLFGVLSYWYCTKTLEELRKILEERVS